MAATLPQTVATAAARHRAGRPLTVTAAPRTPLPSHTGLGTSVYCAVVLVLLEFVGARSPVDEFRQGEHVDVPPVGMLPNCTAALN